MGSQQVRVQHYDNSDAYYVELRDYPDRLVPGICKRTVCLDGLIEGYNGPVLNLDFDEQNRAIGIEILYPSRADE